MKSRQETSSAEVVAYLLNQREKVGQFSPSLYQAYTQVIENLTIRGDHQ